MSVLPSLYITWKLNFIAWLTVFAIFAILRTFHSIVCGRNWLQLPNTRGISRLIDDIFTEQGTFGLRHCFYPPTDWSLLEGNTQRATDQLVRTCQYYLPYQYDISSSQPLICHRRKVIVCTLVICTGEYIEKQSVIFPWQGHVHFRPQLNQVQYTGSASFSILYGILIPKLAMLTLSVHCEPLNRNLP